MMLNFESLLVESPLLLQAADLSFSPEFPVPKILSEIIWWVNMFDSQMVFRDSFSGEVFVFDSNGIWNQEALEHPLLY